MDRNQINQISMLIKELEALEKIEENASVFSGNYILTYVDSGKEWHDKNKRFLPDELMEEIEDILDKHNNQIVDEIKDRIKKVVQKLEKV